MDVEPAGEISALEEVRFLPWRRWDTRFEMALCELGYWNMLFLNLWQFLLQAWNELECLLCFDLLVHIISWYSIRMEFQKCLLIGFNLKRTRILIKLTIKEKFTSLLSQQKAYWEIWINFALLECEHRFTNTGSFQSSAIHSYCPILPKYAVSALFCFIFLKTQTRTSLFKVQQGIIKLFENTGVHLWSIMDKGQQCWH
jgi:hypothetical protein